MHFIEFLTNYCVTACCFQRRVPHKCVCVCVNSQTKFAQSVLIVLGTGWEFLINAEPLYKLTVQNMRQFQRNIIIFQVHVAGTQSWELIMHSKQPSMARQSFIYYTFIKSI